MSVGPLSLALSTKTIAPSTRTAVITLDAKMGRINDENSMGASKKV
jgi:hypothetical protein